VLFNLSVFFNRVEIFEMLMSAGANLNKHISNQFSLLALALEQESELEVTIDV